MHGYQGSYLTAYDDGDYGVFAYGSDYGEIDHSYASGHRTPGSPSGSATRAMR